MKLFVNPNDDISLLRVANVPARGLSDVTMERLISASHERNCSVFAAMRHTDVQSSFVARTREAIESFLELVERQRSKLQTRQISSLASWARTFIEEIGYSAEVRRMEKTPEAADNRLENLRALTDTLPETVVDPEQQLQDFLEDLSLDSDRQEEKENNGDAVTLITIHSCKGLEFPHVHIVGLEDGLFPHSRSKVEGTLDEERRLFYVAVTRAKETLTLSHCNSRKKYGQAMPLPPVDSSCATAPLNSWKPKLLNKKPPCRRTAQKICSPRCELPPGKIPKKSALAFPVDCVYLGFQITSPPIHAPSKIKKCSQFAAAFCFSVNACSAVPRRFSSYHVFNDARWARFSQFCPPPQQYQGCFDGSSDSSLTFIALSSTLSTSSITGVH